MIIANPIYDVIFKRLLENDRVAKFLIGTILDCNVVSLTPTVSEHTKRDKDSGTLTLFRMDFAATIKNVSGEEKRVLIEMQKAKNLADIDRFREYLGTEYIKSTLPIISIYILGFNLTVDSVAFGKFPVCRDLRTGESLNSHDPFVEKLTHTAYFVQTKRIKPSLNTRLDKLLSIFEQANFVSGSETTKDYALNVDDPELKETLDILRYAAADSETRKELDEEEYYQRAMRQMFGEQYDKMEKLAQELAAAKRETEENKRDFVNELRKLGKSTSEIAQIVKLTEAEVEKI